nr:lantibiotic dehydratase C-terminal domain-containing protein [Lysinibacillus sphaericus]
MWVSKHLFIHDYVLIEEFLKECLLPYLDREKVRYFFIRYWDGGPHIRLRYQTAQDAAEKIEKELEHLLESFHLKHSSHSFQAISYDEAIIQTEGIVPTAPYPNFSIQAIEYVPELNRYGGRQQWRCLKNYLSTLQNLLDKLFKSLIELSVMC